MPLTTRMHSVGLLLDFLRSFDRRLPELLPFPISKQLDRVQHVRIAQALGTEEAQQHLAHDPHAELLDRVSFKLFAELECVQDVLHALFDAGFDLKRELSCRGERVVPKLEEGKVTHQVFHEGQGARLHQFVHERIWSEDIVREDYARRVILGLPARQGVVPGCQYLEGESTGLSSGGSSGPYEFG